MLVPLLLQVATIPEITTRPLENERAAAEAFEAHLFCLGAETFQRKDDAREVDLLSAEVIDTCSETTAILESELEDVYLRKPDLMPDGLTAVQAAHSYVSVMNQRASHVLAERRATPIENAETSDD